MYRLTAGKGLCPRRVCILALSSTPNIYGAISLMLALVEDVEDLKRRYGIWALGRDRRRLRPQSLQSNPTSSISSAIVEPWVDRACGPRAL
jgi:hypothetical protein